MTDPIWLSPLSHEVPWAGLPQPEAPRLWVRRHVLADGSERLTAYTEDPSGPPSEAARAGWRSTGWVEAPRPRVESGRTT